MTFKKLFVLLLFIPALSFAANTQFTQGKEYKLIKTPATFTNPTPTPKGKVLVQEFFNYGCPWCFKLEPAIEKWLKTKPANVVFERVPVVFESGWQYYAKAYYTAKALGVANKMTPIIFDAIHEKGLNLASDSAIKKVFIENGVSAKDFESAYDFAPSIGIEMNHSNQLMMAYKVFQIPTIVIDGKYKTNIGLVGGNDKKLIQVVNYLVKKESQNK